MGLALVLLAVRYPPEFVLDFVKSSGLSCSLALGGGAGIYEGGGKSDSSASTTSVETLNGDAGFLDQVGVEVPELDFFLEWGGEGT